MESNDPRVQLARNLTAREMKALQEVYESSEGGRLLYVSREMHPVCTLVLDEIGRPHDRWRRAFGSDEYRAHIAYAAWHIHEAMMLKEVPA